MNHDTTAVSIREVYDLINDIRKELSGRLERVEEKVDKVATKQANSQGQMMMIPLFISIVIGAFSLVFNIITAK